MTLFTHLLGFTHIYKVEEERTHFGRNVRNMNKAWHGITEATVKLRERLQDVKTQP